VTTVGAAWRRARDAFVAAGLDTPDLDARLLLASVLGTEPGRLVLHHDDALDDAAQTTFGGLVERRLAREPVGRILGRRGFWDFELVLSDGTLEPRPDTEILVEAVLDDIAATGGRDRPLTIADIGTGSGAILIALLRELPNAFGIGVDLAMSALLTARENAAAVGVAERAAFVRADYGAGLAGGLDYLVSNPPYIATAELDGLSREVREHDPRLALDGGADGLAAYRVLAGDCRRLLAPGGCVAVEFGAEQRSDVADIFTNAGLIVSGHRPDLSGHDRVLWAHFV